jgi:serine/threonine-protein kinase
VTETKVGRRVAAVAALVVFCLAALAAAVVWYRHQRQEADRLAHPPVSSARLLPRGYVAEDPSDRVDALPRVLVRPADGTRLIRIAGGEFLMGDAGKDGSGEDRPAHPVVLSGYYLQETEVTNGEMEAYFQARHVLVKDRPPRWREAVEELVKKGVEPKRHPAVGIPHKVAEDFARWAGGALPTEAQWEFAARSRGKPFPFVWGTEPRSRQLANLNTLGDPGRDVPTSEVRIHTKDRTEQGVFDLAGNVREWCRDRWGVYEPSSVAQRDPQGPREGSQYVVRGGSFSTYLDVIRTTSPRRPKDDEDGSKTAEQVAENGSADDLGFRIVIEWPPKP